MIEESSGGERGHLKDSERARKLRWLFDFVLAKTGRYICI